MHIPFASAIGFLWNRLRGRPTVQADRRAVAAGGDQTISAPLATGNGAVATAGGTVASRGAIVMEASAGGMNIQVQAGATANFALYVNGLPTAPAPTRDHFLEGRRLQEADHHEEAISEFQAAFGDAATEGQRGALHLLIGMNHAAVGRLPVAEGEFREALRHFEETSDNRGKAAALCNLGLIYADYGDLETAEQQMRRALTSATGLSADTAEILDSLGTVEHRRGNMQEAERLYREALRTHVEINDAVGQAGDLINLALLYRRRGELRHGEGLLNEALELAIAAGDRSYQATALANLGIVRFDLGDEGGAEDHFRRALVSE